MSDQEALVQAIARLRKLRELAYDQNAFLALLEEALWAFPEWQHLKKEEVKFKTLNEEIRGTEVQVRELALEVYGATGEKRPAAGVQIKLLTRLVYDVKAVTVWARTHLPDVLKLDVKPFERIVKAGLPDAPVEIVEESVAYIDAELPE